MLFEAPAWYKERVFRLPLLGRCAAQAAISRMPRVRSSAFGAVAHLSFTARSAAVKTRMRRVAAATDITRMKVFVAGATGTLGIPVVRQLVADGHEPGRYLFGPTAPPAPRHQCWGSLGNLPRASGYRRVRLRSARVARQRGRAGTVCDLSGSLPARREHHGVFRALDEFNHHARDGGLPSRHAMASSADDAC
jgi:hypothetical protein